MVFEVCGRVLQVTVVLAKCCNPLDGRVVTGDQKLDGVEVMLGELGKGFAVQPRRWIIERTFAWLIHNRRLVRRTHSFSKHAENHLDAIHLFITTYNLG